MKKIKLIIPYLFPLSFFAFICWIIYMADKNINNIFFELTNAIPHGDKLGHLMLYGVLTMLLNLSLNCRVFRYRKLSFQLGGSIVFVFAFLEELSQYFFPNRNLDYIDLIFDLIGILIFNYLSVLIKKKFFDKSSRSN